MTVFKGHYRSFGVKKKIETRTGVNSNVGQMRTNAHDADGEEVIDTGLDDMMIDSNINIGLGSNQLPGLQGLVRRPYSGPVDSQTYMDSTDRSSKPSRDL